MSVKPGIKNCVRCEKRCRAVAKVNHSANIFVKGDIKTGRFCVECLVVDFFKNFEIGPSSALGAAYFDHSLPQPEYHKETGDPDRRFDPECLRLSHIQQQMTAVFVAAQTHHGAELDPSEIDWDEVIANWHLPFPPKRKRRRGKGTA